MKNGEMSQPADAPVFNLTREALQLGAEILQANPDYEWPTVIHGLIYSLNKPGAIQTLEVRYQDLIRAHGVDRLAKIDDKVLHDILEQLEAIAAFPGEEQALVVQAFLDHPYLT